MKHIIYLAPILCIIVGISDGELIDNFDRFQCDRKKIGSYYADLNSHCTKFHACVLIPNFGVRDFLFHCPLGTQFDQEAQICNDWGDIDCGQAYSLSSSFGVYDNIFGKKSNSKISSLHLTNQVTQKPVALNSERKINIVASNNLDSQNTNNDESDLFQGSYSSNFFQRRNDVLSDLKYDKTAQTPKKSHNRKLSTQTNANSLPITTEKQSPKIIENKNVITSSARNTDIKVTPLPYNKKKTNSDSGSDIKITFKTNNATSTQYNQQINRKIANTNVYQAPTTYKPAIQDYKSIEAKTRSNQRGHIRQNNRQNQPRFIEKSTTAKLTNIQSTSEPNLFENSYYTKSNIKNNKPVFPTSTDSVIRTTKLQKTKNQTTTEIPSRRSRVQQSNYKYNSSPTENLSPIDSKNPKINEQNENKFITPVKPNYSPEKVQKFDSSTKTYVFPDKTQKFDSPIKTSTNPDRIQKYDSTTKSNYNLEKIQKFDTSTKIYINAERFQKFDSTTKSNINFDKVQPYDNAFKSNYNLEKSPKFDATTKTQKQSNIQIPIYDTTTKFNTNKVLNRNDGIKFSGTTELTQSSISTPKSYYDKTSNLNYAPSGFVANNKPVKPVQSKDNLISTTTTTQRGFPIVNNSQKTNFKDTKQYEEVKKTNKSNKQIKNSGKSKQNGNDDDNYDYAYYDSARDPEDYEDVNVDFKRTTKRNNILI